MQILSFARTRMQPIAVFDAVGAANLRLGGGHGESHVYALQFDPGGSIGAHPAGYGQLFLVIDGAAWIAGADGARVALAAVIDGAADAAPRPGRVRREMTNLGQVRLRTTVSRPIE
jgi:hypothetical protein